MVAPTTEKVTRYSLDKRSSSFTVRAFATGMLASFGHSPTFAIRDFSGEIRFLPDRQDEAGLTLKIKAESIELMDDIKNSDRKEIESTMRQSVLEIEKYPEISFDSTRATMNQLGEGRYQANMTGNLALHGVTQPVTIPAQVTLMGDMLRTSGEFSLLQSQYSIKPVSVAGGAMKLKDELKFKFDIVARVEN